MSMKRSDGRSTAGAIRDHIFGLDVLQQADGSARLVAGKSEILVSLMGPMAVKSKQELSDRACIQVTVQTLSTPPSIEETAMAVRLRQILEETILAQLHPRTLISLVVQPINLDGSRKAHMLNTCVAALIDGAIPMRTTIVGVYGCKTADGLVVDPSSDEEKESTASFFFVFDIQKEATLPIPMHAEVIGDMEGVDMEGLYKTCFMAAKSIGSELRKTVRSRLDLFRQSS